MNHCHHGPRVAFAAAPRADKGASCSFVALLWPLWALNLSGGPEGPCFELLKVFAPKQIKGLDPVPREARRASWALYCLPVAVFVPRGTAKLPGLTLIFAILFFFGFRVKVRYTVRPRISVGSVQLRFVHLSLSSSFVEFRRVSKRSSFRSSSFAPFGAYETCFCHQSWALLPSFGSLGVFASWWLGGRCVGLVGGLISVRFWLSRRPLTRFHSFLFELVRIVSPLELEISFV